MKKCSKCGEIKELSEFNKCKSFKDGHQYSCRLCSKKHYASNRERRLVSMKEYYENNKEKLLEYKKVWYKSLDKDVKREKNKAWYQANKELLHNKRQANREKKAKYDKAYREANKEARFEQVARRKALKKKLIPKHLITCPTEKDRLLKIYRLRALMNEVTGVDHHVDHMWPLADGGPHWSGNLQIIPAEENLSKGAAVDPAIKATIQEMLAEEERLHAEH